MKWNTLVDDDKLKIKIENKLEDIFIAITKFNPTNSLGLLGGYAGVFLFVYFYYQYTKQEKHLRFLIKNFETFYNNIWRIKHSSFANGYAGICWLIRFFEKEDVLEVSDVDEVLAELDSVITIFMLQELQNKNWDFLHGSLGVAYYFATVKNTNKFDNNLHTFLQFLDKNKKINTNGSYKWLSNTYVNSEKQAMVYNLSLSHGMAALIPFLTRLSDKPYNDLTIDLLNNTILFFKDCINPSNFIATYPKWFELCDNSPSESPLYWCYGDPGIAQALYTAGVLSADKELSSLALTTLIKSTNRNDPNTEYINEACFCHGSSSLLHIYNRLYQKTNLDVFKNSALFWLNDTLGKGKKGEEYAGYNFFKTSDLTSNVSLLSGLSGVGLSLLAAIDTSEPSWDECVLL